MGYVTDVSRKLSKNEYGACKTTSTKSRNESRDQAVEGSLDYLNCTATHTLCI